MQHVPLVVLANLLVLYTEHPTSPCIGLFQFGKKGMNSMGLRELSIARTCVSPERFQISILPIAQIIIITEKSYKLQKHSILIN